MNTKANILPQKKTSTSFDVAYQRFLARLKHSEPFVFERVKTLEPILALHVKVKFGENRFELKYNNGYYIKIPLRLYQLFSLKSEKLSQQ